MKIQKIIIYSVAVILFVFGILQYNDPDFFIWFPIYFITSLVPVLYLKKKISSLFILLIIISYSLFLIAYIPDILDWFKGGMESITGSMKAESPHIELAREFFGLVLCEIVLVVFYFKSRNEGMISYQ